MSLANTNPTSNKPPRRGRVGRTRQALLIALAVSVLLIGTARAGVTDFVYAMGYSGAAGTASIYQVNLADGTATTVYTGYPVAPASSNSAALALRASDGMLFYIAGAADGAVYRWDPATPAVAPAFVGTTGGAPYMPRLTFAPDETLYGMNDAGTQLYTINTSTGAATASGTPLSGTPTGGGDMAFNPADGVLYLVAGTTLYTVPLGGGSLISVGSITGMAAAAVGVAFDPVGGALHVANSANPGQLYSVNLSTLVATALSGTMSTGMGDLTSVPRPEADLQITNTDGATTEIPGSSVTYTVVVTNGGPSDAPGTTVTDTPPATILTPTWTCVAAGGAVCPAASGSGSISETIATFPAGSSLTYTLTGMISSSATGTLVNTASVSAPAGVTDPEPANNSATDTDTLNSTIVATNDAGSVADGAVGGTAVATVLGNDTLGGAAATLSNVTLSQLSSTDPGVSLNPATGAVNVAAGTAAGTYSVTYQICEQASPANCDSATVTVTVGSTPPPTAIAAANDTGSVANGSTGGPAVANVLANDTLGGAPATVSNVALSQLSSTNAGVSLNPATGAVNVAAGTPAGTYSLTYQICELANPGNCDSATVTVTVGSTPSPPPPPPPPPPPVPPPTNANLSISKSGPAYAKVGDTVSFKITVRNNGPASAANVVATDTLPAGLALVPGSVKLTGSAGGSCETSALVIRCSIDTLPSGGSVEVSLRATLRSGSESVVNQASVVSTTSDPDGRDNAASWTVGRQGALRRPSAALPKGKASLAVTKTALVKRPVKPGDVFRYRITVRNTGKVAALAVVVCDVPSRKLVFVSAPGATFSNGRACWRIARLAPGETRRPVVSTRLDSNAKRGRVRNDAVASGENTGKKPANDTTMVQVRGVKAGRPGGVTG